MNQSFTSTSSVNSQFNLRSLTDQAPPQLFGFLYDVPKGTTTAQLQKPFDVLHIDCTLQVKVEPSKPFDSAMVKFQSSAHLQVATEKLRYFNLDPETTHQVRFLPFKASLFKGDVDFSTVSCNQNQSMNCGEAWDEDKENCENLPDNSCQQCNQCVMGLDESLTAEDLHQMFSKYGELKSCKVATDPATGKSRCYGFVWFVSEQAATEVLTCSHMPYKTELYKQYCLRALEPSQKQPAKVNTVLVSGYPRTFTVDDLCQFLGAECVSHITLQKAGAEVTLKS